MASAAIRSFGQTFRYHRTRFQTDRHWKSDRKGVCKHTEARTVLLMPATTITEANRASVSTETGRRNVCELTTEKAEKLRGQLC